MNCWVFASNLAGRHGKGSALHAKLHHGAIQGRGWGLQGQSYAIPTKDARLNVMPLWSIRAYVDNFLLHACAHPEDTFNVVAIGCGLAGYKPEQIAPMFKDAPPNCNLPQEFKAILNPTLEKRARSIPTGS